MFLGWCGCIFVVVFLRFVGGVVVICRGVVVSLRLQCCREVLKKSVVKMCWRRVLWKSVGQESCREVLEKSVVKKCCLKVLEKILEKMVAEKC